MISYALQAVAIVCASLVPYCAIEACLRNRREKSFELQDFIRRYNGRHSA